MKKYEVLNDIVSKNISIELYLKHFQFGVHMTCSVLCYLISSHASVITGNLNVSNIQFLTRSHFYGYKQYK